MKIISKDGFFATLIVFISILLFPVVLSHNFFDPFYHTFSDMQIADYSFSDLRDNEDADTNIIIINLRSQSNLDLAMLLDYINQYSPAVVAIEKLLQRDYSDADYFLADAILNTKFLVLGSKLAYYNEEDGRYNSVTCSDSLFTKRSVNGFTNLIIGEETQRTQRTVRQFDPFQETISSKEYSFSYWIAQSFKPNCIVKIRERDNPQETIYYRGDNRKFVFMNDADVFEADSSLFRDKIIMIGLCDVQSPRRVLTDLYFTPMNSSYGGRSFPDMYGLEIQANIVSMMLAEKYYEAMPLWLGILIAFVLCYCNIILLFWVGERFPIWYEIVSLIIFFVESLAILYFTVVLFHENNFELKLTIAIFAIALSIPTAELYSESIKPLTIKTYNKLFPGRKK